jgi:hypothetical protein
MQNNHPRIWFLFAFFFIAGQNFVFAQEADSVKALPVKKDSGSYKTERAVVIYLGGGLSIFAGELGTPSGFNASVTKNHPVGSLRIMWHPGHLMHLGLETGWVRFYSYTIDNNGIKGTTELNATPLLFVLSMPLKERFHVFAGSGFYFMQSVLDYESKVTSKGYSLGYMFAASYFQPITKMFGIAAETKWMDATGTRDAVVSFQLQLRARL